MIICGFVTMTQRNLLEARMVFGVMTFIYEDNLKFVKKFIMSLP